MLSHITTWGFAPILTTNFPPKVAVKSNLPYLFLFKNRHGKHTLLETRLWRRSWALKDSCTTCIWRKLMEKLKNLYIVRGLLSPSIFGILFYHFWVILLFIFQGDGFMLSFGKAFVCYVFWKGICLFHYEILSFPRVAWNSLSLTNAQRLMISWFYCAMIRLDFLFLLCLPEIHFILKGINEANLTD